MPDFYKRIRFTRVAYALANELDALQASVITDYSLFQILRDLYKGDKKLYLKGANPSISAYRRTRNSLVEANVITPDKDYPWTYRILSKQDSPSEEIACLVDPFCYVSHLSAMQRWGLTNRRPEALHLTQPDPQLAKSLVKKKMEQDYSKDGLDQDHLYPLTITHHPNSVRKRTVQTHKTVYFGESIIIKGTAVRVSTIGQTFLTMLEDPASCGGMIHIIDVWKENARKFLSDIIMTVDSAPKDIHKVRAGYILDEIMGIKEDKILKWEALAQRGSSRLLDPSKPFKNTYSEKWMISLNEK